MIDRRSLVERHHPSLREADPLSPFTVGNGRFAFTADATGLQTFADAYEDGIPLHTQSQWGWHSFPNPRGYRLEDVLVEYDVDGRKAPYADGGTYSGFSEPAAYLRANPHRLDLGRIGLLIQNDDGSPISLDAVTEIDQTLDLWHGVIRSAFRVLGQPVRVVTACHPERDAIAFRIESPLLCSGRIGVRFAFPCGSEDWKRAADWNRPDAHRSDDEANGNAATIRRRLDADGYVCRVRWTGAAAWTRRGPHEFALRPSGGETLSCVVGFAPDTASPPPPPEAESVFAAARVHWPAFWETGGAIDLAGSDDPRAHELERRLVLSQYLTAVNCAGDAPPQETGLTCNSWFGKMHLEMHWWHAAHFALWGRAPLMERSLAWYRGVLPLAREHARRQGYRGARWPKMVGPDGRDSPSSVAVFLIWQQPHPIYLAELAYRERRERGTLERYRDIVLESAEFMASFARWEEDRQRYTLGPVIIPAQESYGRWRQTNLNPPYELAYWHWALGVAQAWRERLGLGREPAWDRVRDRLARPPQRDGVYQAIETPPHLIRKDHPSMLAALGVLPATPLIEPGAMSATLDSVMSDWDWSTTWGWDYPMMAMTAARLGRPDDAVAALLFDSPKNVYLPNGHNRQDQRLTLYLPGNGGLLAAAAMMAAGWDGAPHRDAPGFPRDGRWKVRSEGLRPMP